MLYQKEEFLPEEKAKENEVRKLPCQILPSVLFVAIKNCLIRLALVAANVNECNM